MVSVKEVTYEKLMIIKFILMRIFIVLKMDTKVRGLNLVSQEYDQGAWLKQQEFFDSSIIEFDSVEQFLYKYNNNFEISNKKFLTVSGGLRISDIEAYKRYKAGRLIEVFPEKSVNILELGCGFGWNLAVLRDSGHTGNLYGVDISSTAINLCKKVSDKFKLSLLCDEMNILNINDLFVSNLDVDYILIYQVLEQLPKDTENVLEKLILCFPETNFVLIESSSELFPISLSDLISKLYVKKQNYQKSVLKTVRQMAKGNLIKDLTYSRYYCSGKFGHENMIVRFRSNK